MVAISLAGPKINPNAFALDKTMFKLQPKLIALIVCAFNSYSVVCKILVVYYDFKNLPNFHLAYSQREAFCFLCIMFILRFAIKCENYFRFIIIIKI